MKICFMIVLFLASGQLFAQTCEDIRTELTETQSELKEIRSKLDETQKTIVSNDANVDDLKEYLSHRGVNLSFIGFKINNTLRKVIINCFDAVKSKHPKKKLEFNELVIYDRSMPGVGFSKDTLIIENIPSADECFAAVVANGLK